MWTSRTITITTLAAAALATTAHGQGSPTWNRKVEAIAVQDNPATGGHTVRAFFEVEADGFSAPADLSTEVLIHVNGTQVHVESIQFGAVPAGGGGLCQTNQTQVCCSPSPNGPPLCICSNFVAEQPSEASLQPGDEIMVLLRPSPGALPEPNTADDTQLITYTGLELKWNRRLTAISVLPSAGGPGGPAGDNFFDVFLELDVDATYEGRLDLATDAELLINGQPTATAAVPSLDLDLTWSLCPPSNCEPVTCMSALGETLVSCGPLVEGCGCVWLNVQPGPLFPSVPLTPGDVIEVILRPAPGVLPELPGFPDDDEGSRVIGCPGDTDGDGDVDVDDLNNVIQDWGTNGAANGGDLTGPLPGSPPDGIVDVNDLGAVIANWGVCFPV